jgi:ComEC/Rec2-related protein
MPSLLPFKPGSLSVVLALAVGVGLRLWFFESPAQQAIGETVGLTSLVLTKPDLRYRAVSWHDQGYAIECPLQIALCNSIESGDRLEVSGRLEAPWYPGWFARPRLVVLKVASYQPGDEANILSYARAVTFLGLIRDRVNLVYARSLEQPQAGLLAGIVLGERALLSDEFSEALSRTGTMHVIAASGYNVSVITLVSLSVLTLVMSRKASIVVASLLVGAYAILAGGNPAIVRAALMGLLAYAAQFAGREYLVHQAFVLTSLSMLMLQPWLLHDLSFALSISATWGIIWGTPAIDRLLEWVTDHRILKRLALSDASQQTRSLPQAVVETGLSTTLAATLATLPFSVIVFGQATLVAPLVNALVLWLVSPLMALGGVMAALGLVSQSAAAFLALLAHPLLSLVIICIELGSRVPMASIPVSGIHWLVGAGYWLLLLGWWQDRGAEAKS